MLSLFILYIISASQCITWSTWYVTNQTHPLFFYVMDNMALTLDNISWTGNHFYTKLVEKHEKTLKKAKIKE